MTAFRCLLPLNKKGILEKLAPQQVRSTDLETFTGRSRDVVGDAWAGDLSAARNSIQAKTEGKI